MGKLRLGKQVLRHSVRRDDGPGNYRYARQHRAATDAFFDRVGWICHASTPLRCQNEAPNAGAKPFASPESSGHPFLVSDLDHDKAR